MFVCENSLVIRKSFLLFKAHNKLPIYGFVYSYLPEALNEALENRAFQHKERKKVTDNPGFIVIFLT